MGVDAITPVDVRYRYAIVLIDEDGTRLDQEAVDVDWEPARECARFAAVRRGTLDPADVGTPAAVTPRWHRSLGEPYLGGFQVTLRADAATDGAKVTRNFGTGYFGELTRETCAHLVEQGRLQKGQQVVGLAAAYAVESRVTTSAAEQSSFVAEEVPPALPLRDASLPRAPLVPVVADGHETPGGTIDSATDDMPVFIPEQVFDDAVALTKGTVGRETGGFLVGHLCRDPGSGDLFARVAAQLPARHTVPTATRLTFTPQTWSDMHDGLALRGDDELLLGWWHSHPVRAWCADCPTDRQAMCHLARDFFSRHDRALHRTVFPRAYSVALVINDVAFQDTPTLSMFGWKHGVVDPRGFSMIH